MSRVRLGSEVGQSVILIALVMIVLLAILGLVLDGGDAYLTKRDAQNASDGAAFAGGQALRASSPTDSGIRNVINQYTQANHVANASTDVKAYYLDASNNQINTGQIGTLGAVPANATGVVVTSTITFNSFFIGLVTGSGSNTIPARAKVQTGQLTSPGSPLVPMTVPVPTQCQNADGTINTNIQCFPLNTPVDLFGTTTAGGNFQWIDWQAPSPANENDIAQYIYGDHVPPPPQVSVGDYISATTGISVNKCTNHQDPNSSIICALDYWLGLPMGQRRWVVPVFLGTNGQSGNNLKYKVVAFALFYPTGYYLGNGSGMTSGFTGNQTCVDPYTGAPADKNTKCIVGEFQKFVPPGEVNPGQQCNTNALDVCGIQLQE